MDMRIKTCGFYCLEMFGGWQNLAYHEALPLECPLCKMQACHVSLVLPSAVGAALSRECTEGQRSVPAFVTPLVADIQEGER